MMPHIDFYVISPHGGGMGSFLYYINLMGIPSCHHRWHFHKRKVTMRDYPIKKTLHNYYYGLTVDRKLSRKIAYGSKMQNIIWLMRDPISLITSHINHGIGNSIHPFSVHNRIFGLNDYTFNRIFNFKTTLMYSSQLKTVESRGDILSIDTSDLSSEKIYNTLEKVSDFMDIKMPSNIGDIIKIPYNTFENRLCLYAPLINLKIKQDYNPRILFEENILYSIKNRLSASIKIMINRNSNNTEKVGFCKSNLYDFYFNHWKKTYIVSTKIVNNEPYTIFCDTMHNHILDNHANDTLEYYISQHQRYINYILSIYNTKKISCDDVIDFFVNNRYYYDKFMFICDDELKLCKKFADRVMSSWNYFHKLCR